MTNVTIETLASDLTVATNKAIADAKANGIAAKSGVILVLAAIGTKAHKAKLGSVMNLTAIMDADLKARNVGPKSIPAKKSEGLLILKNHANVATAIKFADDALDVAKVKIDRSQAIYSSVRFLAATPKGTQTAFLKANKMDDAAKAKNTKDAKAAKADPSEAVKKFLTSKYPATGWTDASIAALMSAVDGMVAREADAPEAKAPDATATGGDAVVSMDDFMEMKSNMAQILAKLG